MLWGSHASFLPFSNGRSCYQPPQIHREEETQTPHPDGVSKNVGVTSENSHSWSKENPLLLSLIDSGRGTGPSLCHSAFPPLSLGAVVPSVTPGIQQPSGYPLANEADALVLGQPARAARSSASFALGRFRAGSAHLGWRQHCRHADLDAELSWTPKCRSAALRSAGTVWAQGRRPRVPAMPVSCLLSRRRPVPPPSCSVRPSASTCLPLVISPLLRFALMF